MHLVLVIMAVFVASLCAVLRMSHMRSQVIPVTTTWAFSQGGSGSQSLHITGSGSGHISWISTDASRTPDGTRFQVTFQPGGTTVDSGCITNSSGGQALPGGTTSIDVVVTNNCNGVPGGGASWSVSVGP